MDLPTPRYRPPPKGYRTERDVHGCPPTRRNKDEGPYGLYIEYGETIPSDPCDEDDMPKLEPLWGQATGMIHAILWGNQDERRRAKDELDHINDRIERCLKYLRLGTIETENWYKAGDQLEQAVRDYLFYGSTARFEDVRDFIWERIRAMNYPVTWRVMSSDFEEQIRQNAEHVTKVRAMRWRMLEGSSGSSSKAGSAE
ncbi:hypothetical protein BDV10DRAFT_189449 [Aspergillus recurvatus]